MKRILTTIAAVGAASTLFTFTAFATTGQNTNRSRTNVTITTEPANFASVSQKQKSVCLYAEQYIKNQPKHVSFDTPGFIQYTFSKVNVQLPRTILEQSKAGKKILNRSQLQQGDMVFFNLINSSKTEVTFDGIYLGNNTIAALTTHGIKTISMNNTYWSNKFRFGVRIL